MSNEKSLVKTLSKSLAVGSLSSLVRASNESNVALLLDCSGSMDIVVHDDHGKFLGRAIDQLRKVVADVRAKQTCPAIAFGPQFGAGAEWNVAGFIADVPEPAGSTPLAQAIDFAREQGLGRLVLISDGCPDNPMLALEAAKAFGGRIDIVYCGPTGDAGKYGIQFLQEIAAATGGEQFEGDFKDTKELTGVVAGLLAGAVLEDVDDEDLDDDEDDDDEDDDDDDEDDE